MATKKELMTNRIKKSADNIVWQYQMGYLSQMDAHKMLTELNTTCFAMYIFELSPIDPGETQEYIHALQEKYTTETV